MGFINCDTDKLDKIGEYVAEFQREILKACDEVEDAARTFNASCNEEDVTDVDETIRKIRTIIDEEQDTFIQLKTTIENYSKRVKKMKAILRK